jgi:hypothetical protein
MKEKWGEKEREREREGSKTSDINIRRKSETRHSICVIIRIDKVRRKTLLSHFVV